MQCQYFRRGKQAVSRLAAGTDLFILLFKLVEILISTKVTIRRHLISG